MVECIAVSILKCSIGDVFDPRIGNVVLLLGFEGADASTGVPGMTDESPPRMAPGPLTAMRRSTPRSSSMAPHR